MNAFRILRVAWPLVFLLPGGVFAGRLCWIDAVDPLYHAWLRLHENAPIAIALLALVCVGITLARFMRIQRSVQSLVALGRTPPQRVVRAFADAGVPDRRIVFVDAHQRFCFTVFHGPTVVISSGFAGALDDDELRVVAQHESLHVRRRDPWRAFAWHLGFAALIVPLFEDVERLQHALREYAVDAHIGLPSFASELPQRRTRMLAPIAITAAVFAAVVLSHAVFMHNLAYLQTHHC